MQPDDPRIPGLGGDSADQELKRLLAEPRELLCHCEEVPASVVLAVIARGARTVDEVTTRCSAGGGCSSCHGLIEALLEARGGLGLGDDGGIVSN